MSAQIVPVTNDPNQSLAVTLDVDGSPLTLQLRIRYSEIASCWHLTLFDSAGTLLLDSIPLLSGAYPAANLLSQYGYLGIGSAYLINASGIDDDGPTSSNLGTDWILLWDDTAS